MKQAVRRKYHYIYKITRLDESGKYYIGMHSTDNLDDGYFGSGKLITRSIKKHGKEKHSKEVLEFLPSREVLKLREKELVNDEMLSDKKCMNLMRGGHGGSHGKEKQMWEKPGYREKVIAGLAKAHSKPEFGPLSSKRAKLAYRKNKNFWGASKGLKSFQGKKHSAETKNAMCVSHAGKHTGEKNSQFGKCWVTKDGKSISIQKASLDEFLDKGYFRGRTISKNVV